MKKQARSHSDIFSIGEPEQFLFRLHDAISCRGAGDYAKMEEIGKLTVALHEFVMAIESDGIAHYLFYAENRWNDVGRFLELIEASYASTKFADMLSKVTAEAIHKDQIVWPDLLEQIENDQAANRVLIEFDQECQSLCAEVKGKFHAYMTSRRDELTVFVEKRMRLTGSAAFHLSDDDVRKLAYTDTKFPFEGKLHLLLDVERIALIAELACDQNCPTRNILFSILYAICGNIGSQILAGKNPHGLQEMQAAISQLKMVGDTISNEWASNAENYLASPTHELTLTWMARAF